MTIIQAIIAENFEKITIKARLGKAKKNISGKFEKINFLMAFSEKKQLKKASTQKLWSRRLTNPYIHLAEKH